MPDIAIRPLEGDELVQVMHWLDNYAFHASPPLPDRAEWEASFWEMKGPFYFALYEDGVAVATAAGLPLTQNVRGAIIPVGGVLGVTTHPAARRHGYSRRVLAHLLAAFRDAGRPLSCLYPFRESFYEKLGYAGFPRVVAARLSTAALAPLAGRRLEGRVDLKSFADGHADYLDYLHRAQLHRHGLALFEQEQTELPRRNRSWLAFARLDGRVAGLMQYQLKGDKITEYTLRAVRFVCDSSPARYLLLQWIAHHAGQARQAELWLPPGEEPSTWLPDLDEAREHSFFNAMGRVVDVAGLAGLPVGPASFAAHVTDPLCPWNEGPWQFEALDGRLAVRRSASAPCRLGIQGLSALVYGTNDPGDFAWRGWGDPQPPVQAAMRALFPRQQPYLCEYF